MKVNCVMLSLYHRVCESCSKLTTENYSTSFTSAIKMLHIDLRTPIFNIYGFVRFADEIVDTFHQFDKQLLIAEFKQDTRNSIERGISTNPILHSFQKTVNEFNIDYDLIEAFFASMEMDLNKEQYDESKYNTYIYGSAEVVGLMCLQVFCERNEAQYATLKPFAQSLGAAFQKVNFLRDIQADYNELDRTYFPNVDFKNFSMQDKLEIERDIDQDFEMAFEGIKKLPWKARFGVYVAFKYYLSLLNKIKQIQPSDILNERVSVPDYQKAYILLRASVKQKLKMI
jgi:15-cis-phytoene synthase